MNEIEVKILEQSHKKLESRLKIIGAKKVFEGELYAIFYKLKNKNEILRLRKEGNKNYLTHKGNFKKGEVKSADETEIEVSDFEITKTLIDKLGYKKIKSSRKNRISYKLDNIKFEFDKLLGEESFVPEFLEIESNNISDLYKGVELLGFNKKDCTNYGGKEIIAHYLQK